MCNVISVAVNCADVGKSTCVRNVATGLALEGKNVLAIDLDPKADLTYYFGVSEIEKMSIGKVIEQAINNIELELEEYVINIDGVDFIPSSKDLEYTEELLKRTYDNDFVLKSLIDKIKHKYDYIIFDCMSRMSMLTLNALNSSDSVIIPIVANFESGRAVEDMIENIKALQRTTNPNIIIEGILFTKHDFDLKIPRHLKVVLYEAHGDDLNFFKTKVVESIKIDDSNKNSLSIFEYNNKSRCASNYYEVLNELGKVKRAFADDEDIEYYKEIFSQNIETKENCEDLKDDIRIISLERLIPYDGRTYESFKNSRYNELLDSIKLYGIKSPILVHELAPNQYEILSGHNRVFACRELEIKEIKAIVFNFSKREEVDFVAKIVN